MDRRLSQLCRPYATPFSNSSLDYHHSDAHIVENGFATGGGVSKSAKVVLGRRDGKAGTRKMHRDLANSGVVTLDGDLIDA